MADADKDKKKDEKKKKKNSIKFRLAIRSQQDPLINDENAPQSVLVELKSSKDRKKGRVDGQMKYGIFHDDAHDYIQPLKECIEVEKDYYFEEFDPKGELAFDWFESSLTVDY